MLQSNDSSSLEQRHQDDGAIYIATMLAHPDRGSLEGAHAQSDTGSSSLSEPEDVSDNEGQAIGVNQIPRELGNIDSEAETERLEDSPKKVRKPNTVVRELSALHETKGQIMEGTARAVALAVANTHISNWSVDGRDGSTAQRERSVASGTVMSTGGFTGRKRKRTGQLCSATDADDDVKPARKRSSSSRIETRATDGTRKSFHTISTASVEEDISGIRLDVSRAEALNPYQEFDDNLDTVSATNERNKRKLSKNEGFEANDHASEAFTNSAVTGVALLGGEVEADSEAEETVEVEVVEEEVDTAAKSEEECEYKNWVSMAGLGDTNVVK